MELLYEIISWDRHFPLKIFIDRIKQVSLYCVNSSRFWMDPHTIFCFNKVKRISDITPSYLSLLRIIHISLDFICLCGNPLNCLFADPRRIFCCFVSRKKALGCIITLFKLHRVPLSSTHAQIKHFPRSFINSSFLFGCTHQILI